MTACVEYNTWSKNNENINSLIAKLRDLLSILLQVGVNVLLSMFESLSSCQNAVWY